MSTTTAISSNALDNVRHAVRETVADIVGDYQGEPETDRETIIERIDEECDALFGRLVQHGRITGYDAGDMVRTAPACCAILAVAAADAWVEDDCGLWDGLTFGVLASMAYFSLRNLIYEALRQAGHDTNNDYPFETEE